MKKSEKAKSIISSILVQLLGCVIIAAGMYNFVVQAKFPMTGFYGISILLYQFWHIPVGLSTIVLNIPVAIICYHLIGKKFFFNSIAATIVSSIMIDYLAPMFPVYEVADTGGRILAAICGGVLSGGGLALIYMKNSSTGGSDFVMMAIKAKKPHWSIGKITFVVDFVIVISTGIMLRDMEGIICGLIVNFITAFVLDKVMYGINAGKMTMIVTDHGRLISDTIDHVCDRGSTIIQARGGYKDDPREVVMCACNTKEMVMVQQAVKEADPNAFMIIMESNEVMGEGFRPLHLGEHESKSQK